MLLINFKNNFKKWFKKFFFTWHDLTWTIEIVNQYNRLKARYPLMALHSFWLQELTSFISNKRLVWAMSMSNKYKTTVKKPSACIFKETLPPKKFLYFEKMCIFMWLTKPGITLASLVLECMDKSLIPR